MSVTLVEALAALPDTADGIAAMLAEAGIKGRRVSAFDCPLACWLSRQIGSSVSVAYSARIRGTDERIPLAAATGEFRFRFDDGYYPELVA